eukprot:491971-Pelagomonas_calceolata.AAC.2
MVSRRAVEGLNLQSAFTLLRLIAEPFLPALLLQSDCGGSAIQFFNPGDPFFLVGVRGIPLPT